MLPSPVVRSVTSSTKKIIFIQKVWKQGVVGGVKLNAKFFKFLWENFWCKFWISCWNKILAKPLITDLKLNFTNFYISTNQRYFICVQTPNRYLSNKSPTIPNPFHNLSQNAAKILLSTAPLIMNRLPLLILTSILPQKLQSLMSQSLEIELARKSFTKTRIERHISTTRLEDS